MNETEKKMSDVALANRSLLKCYLIISIVLDVAYLVEVVKGSRDIGYYAVFLTIGLIPLICSIIMYQKMKESDKLRLLISVGFAVLYAFVVFTTVSVLAFVYALPMLIAITAYSNRGFVIRISIGVLIINILDIVVKQITSPESLPDSATLEIRIAVLIVCTAFLVIVTGTMRTVSQNKIEEADTAKEKSDRLLDKTMSVSGRMAEQIRDVSDKMQFLHESLGKTMAAMQEVTQGTADSVDAVQHQIEETENIQRHIGRVEEVSKAISEEMQVADKEIAAGHNNLRAMMAQVEQTSDAGRKATEELAKLSEYAEKMGTIINVIEGVTTQTSLLSLNASIEAARAGEAGKGFAVVAEEVRTLAGKSANAAKETTELLGETISSMEEGISAADDTAKSMLVAAGLAEEMDTLIGGIVEDTNQQTVIAEEISRGIDQISIVVQQNVSTAESSAAAGEELSAQATLLKELVSKFRLR